MCYVAVSTVTDKITHRHMYTLTHVHIHTQIQTNKVVIYVKGVLQRGFSFFFNSWLPGTQFQVHHYGNVCGDGVYYH